MADFKFHKPYSDVRPDSPDNWAMFEKHDGRLMTAHVFLDDGISGRLEFRNISGKPVPTWCTHIAAEMEMFIPTWRNNIAANFILVGELVRANGAYDANGKFHVWTVHVLDMDGNPFVLPFDHCYELLQYLLGDLGMEHTLVSPMYLGRQAQDEAWGRMYQENREGVVYHRLKGIYGETCRDNRDRHAIKCKFVSEVDCAVLDLYGATTDVNGHEHASVKIALLDNGRFRDYGCVHVRGSTGMLKQLRFWLSNALPEDGTPDYPVLQVQYLYGSSSSLTQPIAQQVRLDKRDLPLAERYSNVRDVRISQHFKR